MVFIPGFGCSGKVWDSTVAHFKDKSECHVLTLAGFAGVPPLKSDAAFLDTTVKGIVEYAKAKNFSNAVVVGHSLGAHVAIRVAAAGPEQFSAAVLVDGLYQTAEDGAKTYEPRSADDFNDLLVEQMRSLGYLQ